jgi:hypothetical protein
MSTHINNGGLNGNLGLILLFVAIILFVIILVFYMSNSSDLRSCKNTLKRTTTTINNQTPCPDCEPCDVGVVKNFISGMGKQEITNMSCPIGQKIALIDAKYTIVDSSQNLDSKGHRMESDLTSLISPYVNGQQTFTENTRTFLNKVNLIFMPEEDLVENMPVPSGSFEDELPTRIFYGNYICA